jgi:spore germination cell wall hydrolase CwlJ-like protein
MSVSRRRPKEARYYASFGLSVLAMGLMPNAIGYQDLAALIARQPDVSQRARAHMMASPFGTIHVARFSFPQPVGTLIPEPPLARLASVVTADPAITGSASFDSGMPMQLYRPRLEFPSVNRSLKGDLLVSRRREEPVPAPNRDLTPGRVKTVTFTRPADASAELPRASAPAVAAQPKVQAPSGTQASSGPGLLTPADLELKPDTEIATKPEAQAEPATFALASAPPEAPELSNAFRATLDDTNAAERLGRLYFGNNPVGDAVGPIEQWPMDEEIEIVLPKGTLGSSDSDLKATAVTPPAADAKAAPLPAAPALGSAGETVAPKGEVTGTGKRPRTPAERLGLDIKQRAKAEKCLADAVYFESRGEVKRGQIAVAQVVMNRVFSGFYPNNVCGVVYQNSHRKLACQFTFACDGIPDVINEPDMWTQAKEIAHDMLDGKLWLPEVGHSTHYHAYWVHPAWVNEMKRLHKIGVHSFYRPRRWGDGAEVPPLSQSQTKPQDDDAAKKAKL